MKQPFAELLILGKKKIEIRGWNTRFRGRFLVHASRIPDMDACRRFGMDPYRLPRGAVIGTAVLTDVKRYASYSEFRKDTEKHLAFRPYYRYPRPTYGFAISDPVRFKKPVPMKGRLSFFDVNLG